MKILISCPLGWWSLLAKECKKLRLQPYDTFDRWTYVDGELKDVYELNIWSRIANKVYIVADEQKVYSFDDLFDTINHVPRKNYINKEHGISIKVSTKNSVLSSEKTIQSVAHKAIIKKLTSNEDQFRNIDNSRQKIKIRLLISNNTLKILINTSWTSLHERNYRQETGEAPIKENLAASLILQSWRKFGDILRDPFCGSGTIAIEAAMIAKNIAPGLQRNFAIEQMPLHQESLLTQAKIHAQKKQFDKEYNIIASDIDHSMIQIAKSNAKKAWVEDSITFMAQDFMSGKIPSHEKNIHLVSNPPYGKRLDPKELHAIYKQLLQRGNQKKITGGFVTLYPLKKQKGVWKSKPCYNGPDKCTFWKTL